MYEMNSELQVKDVKTKKSNPTEGMHAECSQTFFATAQIAVKTVKIFFPFTQSLSFLLFNLLLAWKFPSWLTFCAIH